MGTECVITALRGHTTSFTFEQGTLTGLQVLPEEEETLTLYGIYTARVKHIVPNIKAAFLEINGEICYYSLEDNRHTIFLNPKKDAHVHAGDLLLVQIQKEPVKTKQAVASCYLQLHGEVLVLTYQKPGIGVSKKLSKDWADACKKTLEDDLILKQKKRSCGLVVRTGARDVEMNQILAETHQLLYTLEHILLRAQTSVCGKCLYERNSLFEECLQQLQNKENVRIITDQKDCYESLTHLMKERLHSFPVEYDEKEVSLCARYDLNKRLDELLLKKVWLPCGANIVIEPTEALTVIDVNTGKSIRDKKTKEEHFLFVNKEAAKEIARQLKLRNLSGIIIVDFIDMKQEASTKELLSYFSSLVRQDPVHTMIVGMTPLHLCEITRKKVQKPLHEQWNRALSVAK